LTVRLEPQLPTSLLDLLKQTRRFVAEGWQHAPRDGSPDQGFEQRFREHCVRNLVAWTISQNREMAFGSSLETASGVLHEIDLVGSHAEGLGVFELKNRRATPPDKNDVIVFFAKLLDYLARTPSLLFREVCPVFLSSASFEPTGLATCLGLGIHPVAPDTRPLPVLVDAARRMAQELENGLLVSDEIREDFSDFAALLNKLGVALSASWLGGRCGFQSEGSIVVRAISAPPSLAVSDEFRQANSDCSRLLQAFKVAKAEGPT